MHTKLEKITREIIDRSHKTREAYLARIEASRAVWPSRKVLGCGNLAHGFAACEMAEKNDLKGQEKPNIAIVSSYNDMLSAHEPYKEAPDLIKSVIRNEGGVCQFAGGVPAMCDGITQGFP